MDCPRCGKEMSGGICNNCGFPLIQRIVKNKAEVKVCRQKKVIRFIKN